MALHRTKVRGRFCKILWPSQNMWTLTQWFDKIFSLQNLAYKKIWSGFFDEIFTIVYSTAATVAAAARGRCRGRRGQIRHQRIQETLTDNLIEALTEDVINRTKRTEKEKKWKIGKPLFARTKGQLISKANFEVFIWTKERTKIFLYFCPNLLNGPNHKNNGSLSC